MSRDRNRLREALRACALDDDGRLCRLLSAEPRLVDRVFAPRDVAPGSDEVRGPVPRFGCCLLSWACGHGSVLAARALLRAGAPVDGPDPYADSPLIVAARRGNIAIMSLLLNHGADPGDERGGVTALSALLEARWDAAAADQAVRLHLNVLSCPDVIFDASVRAAMIREPSEGALAVASVIAGSLARSGGRPRVCLPGMTPLLLAVIHSTPRMVLACLGTTPGRSATEPADWNPLRQIMHPHQATLLHYATLNGPAMVGFLLERGLDPRARDAQGLTPMHYAVMNNSVSSGAVMDTLWRTRAEVVRSLAGRGGDPNVGDVFGRTPLMHAAVCGNVECARALIDCGANPDSVDKQHGTALHIAAAQGHCDMCWLLVERGASVRNRPPLHAGMLPCEPVVQTAIYGMRDCGVLLLELGAVVDVASTPPHLLATLLEWEHAARMNLYRKAEEARRELSSIIDGLPHWIACASRCAASASLASPA
jgi:ankyrin repeat protein